MTPRVSVVLAVYNGAAFLHEAIDSVRAQSFADWELLLVDDGCTDASPEIMRAATLDDPARVRVMMHPDRGNHGLSASRNLGLRHARAPYVAFLDADDVWEPAKLALQVSTLDAHTDVAMLYAATRWWYGWTGRPDDVARDHVPDLMVAPGIAHHPPSLLPLYLRHGGITPCTGTVVVRRDAALAAGGFEERFRGLYEDQVFYAKLALRGAILRTDDCLLRYRQHPNSMCATNDGDAPRVRLAFLEWLARYLHESRDLPPAEALRATHQALAEQLDAARAALAPSHAGGPAGVAALPGRIARRVARLLLPSTVRRYLRNPASAAQALRRAPGVRRLQAMGWRRLTPMHAGRSTGTAIVRWYWARFLEQHRADVQGRALEIGGTSTIRAYGGQRLRGAEAIDVAAHSPDVAIVADLSRAHGVAGERYDCFVVQFTMHVIADADAALYHAIRLLRPGGVLLVNFSCVDYQFPAGLDMGTGSTLWVHWCFTPLQVHGMLRRLGLSEMDYTLETKGNLLARVAYQMNVPAEELTTAELEHHDPGHPVLVCVRVRRPDDWRVVAPAYREGWTPGTVPAKLDPRTGVYARDMVTPR